MRPDVMHQTRVCAPVPSPPRPAPSHSLQDLRQTPWTPTPAQPRSPYSDGPCLITFAVRALSPWAARSQQRSVAARAARGARCCWTGRRAAVVLSGGVSACVLATQCAQGGLALNDSSRLASVVAPAKRGDTSILVKFVPNQKVSGGGGVKAQSTGARCGRPHRRASAPSGPCRLLPVSVLSVKQPRLSAAPRHRPVPAARRRRGATDWQRSQCPVGCRCACSPTTWARRTPGVAFRAAAHLTPLTPLGRAAAPLGLNRRPAVRPLPPCLPMGCRWGRGRWCASSRLTRTTSWSTTCTAASPPRTGERVKGAGCDSSRLRSLLPSCVDVSGGRRGDGSGGGTRVGGWWGALTTRTQERPRRHADRHLRLLASDPPRGHGITKLTHASLCRLMLLAHRFRGPWRHAITCPAALPAQIITIATGHGTKLTNGWNLIKFHTPVGQVTPGPDPDTWKVWAAYWVGWRERTCRVRVMAAGRSSKAGWARRALPRLAAQVQLKRPLCAGASVPPRLVVP